VTVRAAALLAITATYAAPQHLGIVETPEPAAKPSTKPEPRKRVSYDPRRIFQRIVDGSEPGFTKPFDARLLLVNLDSDEDQEVIFVLTGSPASTIALIFDKQKEGWWQIGHFTYSWHWDANQAEKLIELREIVGYGRKDIIVRERAGGTGVATTELSIYRLLDGRLYRVFNTEEDNLYAVYGTDVVVRETRRVEFPESRLIVVHLSTTTTPDNPTKANPVRTETACAAYRWHQGRFTFIRDAAAAKQFCNAAP
jgi:hypothetical protein